MNENFNYMILTDFRDEHILKVFLGKKMYSDFAMPLFYVSHGYAGLSASLKQEFVWTYGIGNSLALMGYARQYFHFEILNMTYPARSELATGWPSLRYWPTIFPWLASDFTFAGCGIIFFFIGIIIPILLKRVLCYGCGLSFTLLGYFSILLIFTPCNNQLMQERPQTMGFLITLLIYLFIHFGRKRKSAKVKFFISKNVNMLL
jgi:hypothetical protein